MAQFNNGEKGMSSYHGNTGKNLYKFLNNQVERHFLWVWERRDAVWKKNME